MSSRFDAASPAGARLLNLGTTEPTAPNTVPGIEVTGSSAKESDSPCAVLVSQELVAQATPRYGERAEHDECLQWAELLARLGGTGAAGQVRRVDDGVYGARWLVATGTGAAQHWRESGAELIRAIEADIAARVDASELGRPLVQVELPTGMSWEDLDHLVYGLALGGYRYRACSSQQDPDPPTVRLIVPEATAPADLQQRIARAAELAAATALARDLSNTPANVKDPAWLGRSAEQVAEDCPDLEVRVRDEHWLAEHGFGGVLAVGSGSASPPRLIEMSYDPGGARTHLLLVGKGITFDTGGISIKPADGMHLMRTDMSGAASVIAALRTVAKLRIGVRVTALVPAVENHVSGGAYRPGDVLRHYGGRTSEIGNTDAEGRLVLADAMAYGVERFRPDAVLDVATLTGAMKVALGVRTGGVFASAAELADGVLAAGERVGEAWWPMPLLDAHADAVTSEVADLKQAPAGPGAIVAALFLREFASSVPWAHLDIAGPARAEDSYHEVTPGGTGFAARTLVELVTRYAQDQRPYS